MADQQAKKIAKEHYENFPVASFLIPKKKRQDLFNIYAFARKADDIADDPSLNSSEKLDRLSVFEDELEKGERSSDELFIALDQTIQKHDLDRSLCFDLLSAFKQDSVQSSYQSFDELLAYSRNSANPIGRLMLQLFSYQDERLFELSDKICTGLQLINFWQDLSVDKKMGRFYVPIELCQKNDLSLKEFYDGQRVTEQNQVLRELFQETEKLYSEGYKLIACLNGRFKYEIKMIWHSANMLFKQSEGMKRDLLEQRPQLSSWDFFRTALRHLIF